MSKEQVNDVQVEEKKDEELFIQVDSRIYKKTKVLFPHRFQPEDPDASMHPRFQKLVL